MAAQVGAGPALEQEHPQPASEPPVLREKHDRRPSAAALETSFSFFRLRILYSHEISPRFRGGREWIQTSLKLSLFCLRRSVNEAAREAAVLRR